MAELLMRLARAVAQGPSPYAAELREETHVLPSFGNLPRVIRAFEASHG